MAQIVKMKRSAVPGKVPTPADLQLGEIAINTYDGKVYIKKDDGSEEIVEVGRIDWQDAPSNGQMYARQDGEWIKVDAEFATDAALEVVQNYLDAHMNDVNNPHHTTKYQVGLGFVTDQGDGSLFLASDGTYKDAGEGGGGGIPEAPVDGNTYGRKDSNWTEVVPSTGGTFYDDDYANLRIEGGVTDEFTRITPGGIQFRDINYPDDNIFTISASVSTRMGYFGLGGWSGGVYMDDWHHLSSSYLPQRPYDFTNKEYVDTNLAAHVDDLSNPHQTDKEDVGLGFVVDDGDGTLFLANDGNYKAGGGEGIPDAPVDGQTYGRKDAGWKKVDKYDVGLGYIYDTGDGTGALTNDGVYRAFVGEAPADGITYGRRDGFWANIDNKYAPMSHADDTNNPHQVTTAQLGIGYLTDSGDGSLFLADDGTYKAGGGSGIPDAPADGNWYGRKDNSWADLSLTYATIADLDLHADNQNNPHAVTYSQVGADPSGSAQSVQDNLTTHENDINNPHMVTKAQVGLGFVVDDGDGSLYLANDGTYKAGGGGIPEAPEDGLTYGRKDAGWTEVVPNSGGTFYDDESPTIYIKGGGSNVYADTRMYPGGFQFRDDENPNNLFSLIYCQASERLCFGTFLDGTPISYGLYLKENEPISCDFEPTADNHLATKGYVDSQGGGGGIPEAPIDGGTYSRRNAAWINLIGEVVTINHQDSITSDIKQAVVDAMPATADPNTIYFIKA